jgi:hypothetical protein
MRTLGQGLLIGATILAISACGSTPTASAPPAADAPTAASSSTTTAGAKSDLTKPFGSTFTWDDGVAVTVSKPAPFKPSNPEVVKMQDPQSKSFVVVDVTLKNGSKEPIDAIMLRLKATTGSREAKQLFDTAAGVDLPTSKILPGADLKWKAAFGVDEGAPFVMTVDYGFGNASGIYKD